MPFDFVIFAAALWALSTEMIEDSAVDLIYGHLFGWRTLLKALAVSSVILTASSAALILFASTYLQSYLGLIQKGSALLLGFIGLFWIGSSILRRDDEVEEARGLVGNFSLAVQLLSIEELEIFLIIVPLFLSSHVIEAASSASMGIALSISLAALFRTPFSKFVEGRIRSLKILSGSFLVGLGIILFLD